MAWECSLNRRPFSRPEPSRRGFSLGVSLVEIACNWRTITHLRSAKPILPDFSILSRGSTICEQPSSVFIEMPQRMDIGVTELRNWVTDNTRKKFRLYNRFQYEEHAVRIEKSYMGVNFRFEDSHDACLFKLFWW